MDRKKIIEKLTQILKSIKNQIQKLKIPEIYIKTRSKNNIHEENSIWCLDDQKVTKKTLKTKGGAKQILKIVHSIDYVLNQLALKKTSTLREFYYNALNWAEEAQFEKVQDSNLCLENLEVLLDCTREDFSIFPNLDGKIFGPIKLSYITRDGKTKEVHCSKDVSTGGFLLPKCINDLKILECNAKFILVVETDGMYSRLIEERFDQKYSCLLVVTQGQASRMTRKFLKKMYQVYNLRSAIFTDGDCYGFKIAQAICTGSIKSAHLSRILCTPYSKHIGLFPSQVKQHNLPSAPIELEEIKSLKLMLEQKRYDSIKEQVLKMLETGRKAEQQALSFHGFEYVSETYLPMVLKKAGFL